MASPIDLCQIGQVRSWLSLNSGLPGNSSQTSIVNTSVSTTIPSGIQTVTPFSMLNIIVGLVLSVDTGMNNELVVVTATSSTTFTATFSVTHTYTSTPIFIGDQTDAVLSRVITAASSYILWRTGQVPLDGSTPTTSPFVSPVSYNQQYDGNGNDRLFLRNYPIVSVQSLTINGVSIPQSTGYPTAGFVIDGSYKALAFPNSGGTGPTPRGYSAYPFSYRCAVYNFSAGTQNINVQYTAGYATTPYDLNDAVIKMVAYNYRRRDWEGIKQQAEPQSAGTMTYQLDWIYPPGVEEVINYYTRKTTA